MNAEIEQNSISMTPTAAANISSAALIAGFFLPWINFLIVKPSGFNLAAQGGKMAILWAIPMFALITLLAGISKNSQRGVAQVTGVLPIVALGAGLYDMNTSLLEALQFGAYLSVIAGIALLAITPRLK
ncbi:MAG TPA: hypothetical protein VEH27_17540 [Methylomirabilota bacterium]|nr:hypothetical protein [Methylomirabilota bacterium]